MEKTKTSASARGGFTLIELIIVIAILAFVTVVGIHNYGNVKEVQAKKVNVANIKRVYAALSTYETLCKEQGETGYFGGFDSLVDVKSGGKWTGAEGTVDFGDWTITETKNKAGETTGKSVSLDARQANGGYGIYDGSWKALMATYNAAGAGSGAVPDISTAQEQNKGTRVTGLYKVLGLYYLTKDDATLLRDAGINYLYMHNPSTAQAHGASRGGFCTGVREGVGQTALSEDGLKVMGGGPGFRPDQSAFYPVYVTNGLPVAILSPTSSAYDDLGFDLGLTNSAPTEAEAIAAVSSTKLICFGIGRNAECVRSQLGLGEAPYNPAYDKRNYRSYIAVFALKKGGQGIASSCRLVGVLDCAGQTYRAAEYGVNWSTTLGN